MAQLNSCSRVSKLLMCHNLLSGYYTLEEGTLVFGRSLQLLIRDKRQVTLLNGNIKIPNLGFIISNRILNTFLCFHQLQLQLLSTKFCILYCYITDHYAHNVHTYILQLSMKPNKLYYCSLCLCHKRQEYKSFGMVKVTMSCFIFCFESFLLPAILASSSTRYLSVVVDDVIDYGS